MVVLRRSFLAGLGLAAAGLALGVVRKAQAAEAGAGPSAWPPVPGAGLRAGVFVHVGLDGQVTIVCHRSEMGQGVRSSLPVLIADELGADMARVTVVQGDGDKAYGDQNTDGSSSVRKRFGDLRAAGAAARMMLISAAAARWKVDPRSCEAHDHQVFHTGTR
ncbi:MAG: xanthine dehydrogenase family protein molybdopterin-binding subunit, partial [Myxococcales bacterium]